MLEKCPPLAVRYYYSVHSQLPSVGLSGKVYFILNLKSCHDAVTRNSRTSCMQQIQCPPLYAYVFQVLSSRISPRTHLPCNVSLLHLKVPREPNQYSDYAVGCTTGVRFQAGAGIFLFATVFRPSPPASYAKSSERFYFLARGKAVREWM
jgi:hypothetical protein